MLRKKIILSIFILSTVSFYSQNIKGIIINSSTSQPLEKITIQNLSSNELTVSSEGGTFNIRVDNLPVNLEVSAMGFENRIIEVTNYNQITIYIDPVPESLSEIIIRSTHIPSSLRKIPAAVSVISSNDLERLDPTNFAQAFNSVPGVYVNQGALNTTKLNIRGIGARSQYSTNRIQANFNGIPLTTAEGELTLDDIDPEAISKVEIIKGPVSSIYGAGLGGVINLYSAEAENGVTRGTVKNIFGSYNMNRKTVTASHGTESTSVFFNYNDLKTDGYRENGEYSRKSFLSNVNLETSEDNNINILANFTRLKAFIPSSINEDDFRNDPETAAFTWAQSRGFESYDRGLLGATYYHVFSPSITNSTSVYVNFRDAYEPRPFDILKEERVSAGARSSFNWDSSIFEKSAQFNFGAEYYREWYETGTFENLYREFEGVGSVLGSRLSSNEQDRNYSNFFGQLALEVTQKLKVEGGFNVNITEYNLTDLFTEDEVDQTGDYQFQTIFSPRIGASYEIAGGKNLYASVSHGFSTPTVAETLTPEGQINTNLLPETGINYEVGFKGNWLNNKLYSEVALYSVQIKDLLVAQRVAEDRYVGINAGETSHNGIEVFLNYNSSLYGEVRIRPFFNASFNFFEFKEFENEDNDFSGNKLPGVPSSTINLGLDVMYRNFNFFSNLLSVGEIPLNDQNNAFTSTYSIVNLKTNYTINLLKKLEIIFTAGVNNVLDEKYAASVLPNAVGFGGAAPRYYYPGNPRNYFGGVGVNYQF